LQLTWIIPFVLVPALEQSKMIETLNHMLDDITLCEESKNCEGALSICEEAYKITYGIKNEEDRKNYQNNINLHQAACNINIGSLKGEKNKVNDGLEYIEQIFSRIETMKEGVKSGEMKRLIWWANYYRDFANSLK